MTTTLTSILHKVLQLTKSECSCLTVPGSLKRDREFSLEAATNDIGGVGCSSSLLKASRVTGNLPLRQLKHVGLQLIIRQMKG